MATNLKRFGLGGLAGFGDPKCNFLVYDAYAAAGDAPLVNGNIPSAGQWANPSVNISGFQVVAVGNPSQMDLSTLQPGDVLASITSTGSHVGVYVPVLYTDGVDQVPGYSPLEIQDLGNNSSLAYGEVRIQPESISAAWPNSNNMWSSSPTSPWFSGVTWNGWGFRGDSQDSLVVIRRPITHQ